MCTAFLKIKFGKLYLSFYVTIFFPHPYFSDCSLRMDPDLCASFVGTSEFPTWIIWYKMICSHETREWTYEEIYCRWSGCVWLFSGPPGLWDWTQFSWFYEPHRTEGYVLLSFYVEENNIKLRIRWRSEDDFKESILFLHRLSSCHQVCVARAFIGWAITPAQLNF